MMLPLLIVAYRKTHKVSVRKLARIIGVDHCALFRFEHGAEIESQSLIKVLRWIFSQNA